MFTLRPNVAEPLAAHGLEISRRVLGEEHETTLYFMNLLAWAHEGQKRNELIFACTGTRRADGQYPQVVGKTDVNDSGWHHVVGIYDGTKIALYVDGELDASAAASGRINTSSFKVLLGENDETRPQGHNLAFHGFLDDIRIYDYALTEAEIRLLSADAGVTASDRSMPRDR